MSADQRSLPPGWALTTLDRVGSIRLGRQRSPDRQSGRYPTKYLRAANITPHGLDLSDVLQMDFTPAERALFTLRRGDVILTEASGSAAHVGRAAVWRDEIPDCCFQNTVIRFRPHAVTPEFAQIWFEHCSASGVFGRIARGVGILHLGASRLAALEIQLPPIAEQERISAEVERRRAEIRSAATALRNAYDKLQEQKREVLALAVTGVLVGLDTGNGTEQAGRDDARLANGWRWVRVDEAGRVDLGKKREPSSHSGPDMHPYLRVANVFEDRIDTSDVKEMNFSAEEFEKYVLDTGDILLNEGQSPELVGRPAMYRGQPPSACFQMTLLRFRANPGLDPEFALIVFRHYLHSGEFRRVAQGSTNIVHLSRKRLAAMRFPLPPAEHQAAVVSEVKKRMADLGVQEEAIQSSLDNLPMLTSELLATAVNGGLVPQNSTDEPAQMLLERLGTPPPDAIAVPDSLAILQEDDLAGRTRKPGKDDTPSEELVEALRNAGRPLSIPDLFSAAGYNRDSITDVESFYLALRDVCGSDVVASDDRDENASLWVADDAP